MATAVSSPPQATSPSNATAAPATAAEAQRPLNAVPLFELFVDVPHPAASRMSAGMRVLTRPQHSKPQAELNQLLSQIQPFAFPDFFPPSPQALQGWQQQAVNRYDVYAMQTKSFTSFTFTLQEQDGTRLYGHVRRTLPLHPQAPHRYDIGRRGERALVILTKATAGGGQLFQAILKTIDALTSQQWAVNPMYQEIRQPQQHFLHTLFFEHQKLTQVYQSRPPTDKGKPLVAVLQGLEVGVSASRFLPYDTNRFLLPTSLLQPTPVSSNAPGQENPASTAMRALVASSSTTTSVLPLLRCVGVAHALRILAALLSERRIILTSSSPTRLSSCSHAALALLRTGLLDWQHLYIPVLPPHLWPYLAAPYPYLIGILTQAVPKLDRTEGLGEVLIVHLDSNQMETRNMNASTVWQRLPDLFSPNQTDYDNPTATSALQGNTNSGAAEGLAQDLLEILKTDKKAVYGEAGNLNVVGETAGKAAKAIKSGFAKLRARVTKQPQQQVQRAGSNMGLNSSFDEGDNPAEEDKNRTSDDYIFTEGCHNETGEEEARLAFTVFFLALLGDMRWYLTAQPGQLPVLDGPKFLDSKKNAGDGPGSALWPLLVNFIQTQMLQEFAKARIEEVRTGAALNHPDAPLFSQCAQYHRQHNITFTLLSVRRVAQQVASAHPGRLTGLLQTNARRMAMSLTSNKNYEGDYGRAVAQLVEQCRETTSVLFDVMSVIWWRIRDSKGLQWKHGYQALMLLKNLLYHGPLAAVSEATDGLDKIRALEAYDHLRPVVAQDMRQAAKLVYVLLVDRAKLFQIRRVCTDKRRLLAQQAGPSTTSRPKLERLRRLSVVSPIEQIHSAVHPMARGTVAQIPSKQPPPAPKIQPQYDLFAMAGVQHAPPSQPPQRLTSQPSGVNQDLAGLFGAMNVSAPPTAPGPPAPTIAAIPAQMPGQVIQPPVAMAGMPPPSSGVMPQSPTHQQPSNHFGMPAGQTSQQSMQQPPPMRSGVNQFDPFSS